MKIIIVGASGTMGKHLTSAFKKEHEVITAASKGCDVQVDITSTESIENMYRIARHTNIIMKKHRLST